MLGISAAIWGGWVERVGPRRSGFVAALCWGGGLILGYADVAIHQLWLVYLGCGFVGGVGQGLGYITPVSTLIKWFPDRRGMATGLAIMGYGGGAMIGAPLAVWLMAHFASHGVPGVAPTLMTMGIIYFIAINLGALGFRVPPSGWTPANWKPSAAAGRMIAASHVHADRVWRIPQF
jgi:MFS family permease